MQDIISNRILLQDGAVKSRSRSSTPVGNGTNKAVKIRSRPSTPVGTATNRRHKSPDRRTKHKALHQLMKKGFIKTRQDLSKRSLHRLFHSYFQPYVHLTDISSILPKSGKIEAPKPHMLAKQTFKDYDLSELLQCNTSISTCDNLSSKTNEDTVHIKSELQTQDISEFEVRDTTTKTIQEAKNEAVKQMYTNYIKKINITVSEGILASKTQDFNIVSVETKQDIVRTHNDNVPCVHQESHTVHNAELDNHGACKDSDILFHRKFLPKLSIDAKPSNITLSPAEHAMKSKLSSLIVADVNLEKNKASGCNLILENSNVHEKDDDSDTGSLIIDEDEPEIIVENEALNLGYLNDSKNVSENESEHAISSTDLCKQLVVDMVQCIPSANECKNMSTDVSVNSYKFQNRESMDVDNEETEGHRIPNTKVPETIYYAKNSVFQNNIKTESSLQDKPHVQLDKCESLEYSNQNEGTNYFSTDSPTFSPKIISVRSLEESPQNANLFKHCMLNEAPDNVSSAGDDIEFDEIETVDMTSISYKQIPESKKVKHFDIYNFSDSGDNLDSGKSEMGEHQRYSTKNKTRVIKGFNSKNNGTMNKNMDNTVKTYESQLYGTRLVIKKDKVVLEAPKNQQNTDKSYDEVVKDATVPNSENQNEMKLSPTTLTKSETGLSEHTNGITNDANDNEKGEQLRNVANTHSEIGLFENSFNDTDNKTEIEKSNKLCNKVDTKVKTYPIRKRKLSADKSENKEGDDIDDEKDGAKQEVIAEDINRKKKKHHPNNSQQCSKIDFPGITRLESPGNTTMDSPGNTTMDSPGMTRMDSPGMTRMDSPDITRMDSPGMTRMDSPGMTRMDSPGITRMDSPGMTRMDSPSITRMNSPGITRMDSPDITIMDSLGITRMDSHNITRTHSTSISSTSIPVIAKMDSTGITRMDSPGISSPEKLYKEFANHSVLNKYNMDVDQQANKIENESKELTIDCSQQEKSHQKIGSTIKKQPQKRSLAIRRKKSQVKKPKDSHGKDLKSDPEIPKLMDYKEVFQLNHSSDCAAISPSKHNTAVGMAITQPEPVQSGNISHTGHPNSTHIYSVSNSKYVSKYVHCPIQTMPNSDLPGANTVTSSLKKQPLDKQLIISSFCEDMCEHKAMEQEKPTNQEKHQIANFDGVTFEQYIPEQTKGVNKAVSHIQLIPIASSVGQTQGTSPLTVSSINNKTISSDAGSQQLVTSVQHNMPLVTVVSLPVLPKVSTAMTRRSVNSSGMPPLTPLILISATQQHPVSKPVDKPQLRPLVPKPHSSTNLEKNIITVTYTETKTQTSTAQSQQSQSKTPLSIKASPMASSLHILPNHTSNLHVDPCTVASGKENIVVIEDDTAASNKPPIEQSKPYTTAPEKTVSHDNSKEVISLTSPLDGQMSKLNTDGELCRLKDEFKHYERFFAKLAELEEEKKKEQRQIHIQKQQTLLMLEDIKNKYRRLKAKKVEVDVNKKSDDTVVVQEDNSSNGQTALSHFVNAKEIDGRDQTISETPTTNDAITKLHEKDIAASILDLSKKDGIAKDCDLIKDPQIVEERHHGKPKLGNESKGAINLEHVAMDTSTTDTCNNDCNTNVKKSVKAQINEVISIPSENEEISITEIVKDILNTMMTMVIVKAETAKSNVCENMSHPDIETEKTISAATDHTIDKEMLVQDTLKHVVGPTKEHFRGRSKPRRARPVNYRNNLPFANRMPYRFAHLEPSPNMSLDSNGNFIRTPHSLGHTFQPPRGPPVMAQMYPGNFRHPNHTEYRQQFNVPMPFRGHSSSIPQRPPDFRFMQQPPRAYLQPGPNLQVIRGHPQHVQIQGHPHSSELSDMQNISQVMYAAEGAVNSSETANNSRNRPQGIHDKQAYQMTPDGKHIVIASEGQFHHGHHINQTEGQPSYVMSSGGRVINQLQPDNQPGITNHQEYQTLPVAQPVYASESRIGNNQMVINIQPNIGQNDQQQFYRVPRDTHIVIEPENRISQDSGIPVPNYSVTSANTLPLDSREVIVQHPSGMTTRIVNNHPNPSPPQLVDNRSNHLPLHIVSNQISDPRFQHQMMVQEGTSPVSAIHMNEPLPNQQQRMFISPASQADVRNPPGHPSTQFHPTGNHHIPVQPRASPTTNNQFRHQRSPTQTLEYRPMPMVGSRIPVTIEITPTHDDMYQPTNVSQLGQPIAAVIRTNPPVHNDVVQQQLLKERVFKVNTKNPPSYDDIYRSRDVPVVKESPLERQKYKSRNTDMAKESQPSRHDIEIVDAKVAHSNSVREPKARHEVTKHRSKPTKLQCVNCGNEAIFVCSGCKRIPYCSESCQNDGWQEHSEHCA